MEKNTVLLGLKRYHEFDDLEKAINNKETIELCTGTTAEYHNGSRIHRGYSYRKFLDYGQMDKELMEMNKHLEEMNVSKSDLITKLNRKIEDNNIKLANVNQILIDNNIKEEVSEEVEKDLPDFKNMSIWGFIKWKNKK